MHSARTQLLLVALLSCVLACESGKFRATQAQAKVAAEVSLGRPFVGDHVEGTFPVTAIGDGAFRIVRVSSADPQLSLDWGQQSGRDTVARGATIDVKVSWTPTAPATLFSTLEVELDLEGEPIHTVRVTGEARAVPDCGDGNQCTDDSFDRSVERCVHAAHERACDDGNACTDADRCSAGACRGVAKSCDDDNVCTLNLCDPTSGCVFPPDNRQCDDKDPCTKDVCDPDEGCSFPDADDGTACGDFSCATAHVCVFGTCRELDITDSSDGFPCSDGNACTEGDECLAGQCQSGPPKPNSGPEIVDAIDTYGGENAFVATDGFRYVFVERFMAYPTSGPVTDSSSLLVTVFDGQKLVPHASLPIAATAPPVTVAPGVFAVPVIDRIVIVDATDPDHPTAFWQDPFVSTGKVTGVQLAMMRTGLVAKYTWQETSGGTQTSFVVWSDTTNPFVPGPWKTIYEDTIITEIDGDEDSLVVNGTKGVMWLSLGANGIVAAREVLTQTYSNSTHISVQGQTVAILNTPSINLVKVDMGVKHLVTIPADGVFDVALVGTNLFTTGAAGTWGRTLHELINQTSSTPDGPIELMRGYSLERGRDHVFLTGNVALPLRLTGGTPVDLPAVTRVTGGGHGSLVQVVDSGTQTLLAGSASVVASIDLKTRTFDSWAIRPYSAEHSEAVLLKGAHETVAVDRQVWVTGGALTSCDGPVWNEYDGNHTPQKFQVCGLMAGSVAFTPDRLWATAVFKRPYPSDPSYDRYGLRVWNLNPFASAPLLEMADVGSEESTSVRASEDGKYVAWATDLLRTGSTQPVIPRVRLFQSDTNMVAPMGEFVFEQNEPYIGLHADTYGVTADASLTASLGVVRLHPLVAASNMLPPRVPDGTLPAVTLPESSSFNRVLSMQNGQAWVGWEKVFSQPDPRPRLSQMRYDVAQNKLEDLGEVVLPGTARNAHPMTDYTVVTTSTAVLLVAPSCR